MDREDMELLLNYLPPHFSAEAAENLDKRCTPIMLLQMINSGMLRKQGACYYRPGNPPTLDEAMMVGFTSLSYEEMEELSAAELLDNLNQWLPRRKIAALRQLVRPMKFTKAVEVTRFLYQNLPPVEWKTYERAVNLIVF